MGGLDINMFSSKLSAKLSHLTASMSATAKGILISVFSVIHIMKTGILYVVFQTTPAFPSPSQF